MVDHIRRIHDLGLFDAQGAAHDWGERGTHVTHPKWHPWIFGASPLDRHTRDVDTAIPSQRIRQLEVTIEVARCRSLE